MPARHMYVCMRMYIYIYIYIYDYDPHIEPIVCLGVVWSRHHHTSEASFVFDCEWDHWRAHMRSEQNGFDSLHVCMCVCMCMNTWICYEEICVCMNIGVCIHECDHGRACIYSNPNSLHPLHIYVRMCVLMYAYVSKRRGIYDHGGCMYAWQTKYKSHTHTHTPLLGAIQTHTHTHLGLASSSSSSSHYFWDDVQIINIHHIQTHICSIHTHTQRHTQTHTLAWQAAAAALAIISELTPHSCLRWSYPMTTPEVVQICMYVCMHVCTYVCDGRTL
jgi:hypothetical protein